MSDIDDLFFRKAEMADFDPIWEIIQQAKAQMRQLGTFQWDATYPLPDDIRRDIQEGVGFVMCVDKQVAVYGVISFKGEPVYEQIADSWSNALPYVVVHRLAVADGMKRRGLAGQFMLRAEALSRREGVYGFRVDTKADNQYMLRLLESLGFRLCGKVYYRNGNERLAFEKILYPEAHSFGVEGITIREAIDEDAQAIFEAIDRNRDDLRRWLPFVDGLKTVADEQQFLHPILATPYEKREPVFVLKHGTELCGLIGFHFTDSANHRTEIGYWLLPAYRGKGIVTHAVRFLCRWAFQERGMNRIQIRCAVGNQPSNAIPRRLGFVLEGTERQGELLASGEYTDIHVYGLLKEEFDKRSTFL